MLRLAARATLFASVALGCILHASDSPACGVAYPRGSFARFSREKTLIVWDSTKHIEHFIRALTLKGDPQDFGVFVPTPTVPEIAKEDDAIIGRVAALFLPPPEALGGAPWSARKGEAARAPVEVMQRRQIGDFEAVTLKATDERALGDWLAQNQFVDKPSLRAWEKSYLDKKWLITAIRCTAKGTGDRALDVPTIRMSFAIDAPFFPYTEVPTDAADESAYRTKYGSGGGERPFDVYLIADTPMQGLIDAVPGGPPVVDAVRVTDGVIAHALKDTQTWNFNPMSRREWTVTHLSENVSQRPLGGDLTFASYQGANVRSSSVIDDPAVIDQASPTKHTRLRVLAIAIFFLIAGAAGFAVWNESESERKKNSKEKS